MKYFLLAEIVISAIYTVCTPELLSGGICGYTLHFIISLLFGYAFAALYLLIGDILREIYPVVMIKNIHVMAFIMFLIAFFVGIGSELYSPKEEQKNQISIEEITETGSALSNEETVFETPTENELVYKK